MCMPHASVSFFEFPTRKTASPILVLQCEAKRFARAGRNSRRRSAVDGSVGNIDEKEAEGRVACSLVFVY